MKKAFTLAEVMITLTVIGIITAVIIPVAISTKPDENVLKFKKANETLYNVISTMMNSDKYYLNNDLGMRPNGNLLKNGVKDDITYFCKTFADIVSAKEVNCSTYTDYRYSHYCGDWSDEAKEVNSLDRFCLETQNNVGAEIVTTDGITYFQTSPGTHFGYIGIRDTPSTTDEEFENCPITKCWLKNSRLFNETNGFKAIDAVYDHFGNIRTYRPFCIDIDGLNKGEDPFGYAIRVDGKIEAGKRATEWLAKSIQNE